MHLHSSLVIPNFARIEGANLARLKIGLFGRQNLLNFANVFQGAIAEIQRNKAFVGYVRNVLTS